MNRLMVRMRAESAAGELGNTAAEDELGVTLANDRDDIETDAAAVADVNTGIDNALEAQTEVQAAISTMEESVEEGGLTPALAAEVEHRMERAAALIGDNLGNYGLTFRRESFGGRETRLSATKRRIEAAQGWGSKIWEAIKAGWQWLKDQFAKLLGSVFKSAEGLRKRFDGLEARLNAAAGDKQKESKLSAGARFFARNGEVSFATIQGLVDNSAKYPDMVMSVAKATDPGAEEGTLANALSNSIGVNNVTVKGEDAAKTKFFGFFSKDRTLALTQNDHTPDGGGDVFHTYTPRLVTVGEKDPTDYAALDKAQIRTLITKGNASLTAFEQFKKAESSINAMCEANIKYVENMMKAAAKDQSGSEEERAAAAKEARAFTIKAKGRQAIVKTVTDFLPKDHYDVLNALINVVLANINNFKAEEK